MLAVRKEGPGRGFALRDVPIPAPGAGEVRIKVRAAGICGSDLPIFAGVRAVGYPLIPGHEFAGEIDALGHAVRGWSEGDRVAVNLVAGCLRCDACRAGRENLCEHIQEIGIHRDGAFAEYCIVPARSLHALPDHLSFVTGASVDPVASVYRGLLRMRPGPDDHVVIFGAGPIGLYGIQVVKAAGVASVSVVARSASARTQAAEALGASPIVGTDGLVETVRGRTNGRLASLVVEATGDANVLDDVLAVAGAGARVLLVGVFHGQGPLLPSAIVRRELRVEGSFCYSHTDFARSLDLLARDLVRSVATHVLPLAEIGRGLEAIESREAIKVILEP